MDMARATQLSTAPGPLLPVAFPPRVDSALKMEADPHRSDEVFEVVQVAGAPKVFTVNPEAHIGGDEEVDPAAEIPSEFFFVFIFELNADVAAARQCLPVFSS